MTRPPQPSASADGTGDTGAGGGAGAPPRRWPVRLLTVAGLPLVSVALVLGLFEVGLRLAGHRAIYEIYSKPSAFWVHDALFGWSHQPGASGEYVGPRPWPIEFRGDVSINSLGLRGPEIPPKGARERRVLVLGDSMVAGFEVDQEQTFVARLEALLSGRLEFPVRVVNGGVRGYGTDQTLLFFREIGASLGPDVVVFFHSGNDRADNTTLHEMRRPFGKPAFALREGATLELVGAPVPIYPKCSEVQLSPDYDVVRADTVASRFMCRAQMALFDHSALFSLMTIAIPWDASLLQRLYHIGNPHTGQLARTATGESEENFATSLTMELVLTLAREVRSSGARFLVIGFPDHLEQLDARRLEAAAIPTLSLDALWSAPQEEVRWKHDSHFNPEGHRRLAETLLPVVRGLLDGAPAGPEDGKG